MAGAQEKVVMFVRGRDLANVKMSLCNFVDMAFMVSEPCADPRGGAATDRAITSRTGPLQTTWFSDGGYLTASHIYFMHT